MSRKLSEGFLGYVSNGIAHTLSENFPSGRKNDSSTPSLPMPLIDVKIEFKSFLSSIDCVSLNSIKNSSVSVFSFPSNRIEKISAFSVKRNGINSPTIRRNSTTIDSFSFLSPELSER